MAPSILNVMVPSVLKPTMTLKVASSLRQIGCVVFPYTRLTHASVNPQGARTPPGPSDQANL